MTIGQLDCCSSSCRKAFAYSLQGLKFCPFDCSTRTRLRLAAPAGSEAETTIPRATRHFNTEFTSIPVRGAIDGGPEKCSQYGPLRITIRIDFTQQPSFRSTILLRVTRQSTKCRPFRRLTVYWRCRAIAPHALLDADLRCRRGLILMPAALQRKELRHIQSRGRFPSMGVFKTSTCAGVDVRSGGQNTKY